MLSRRLGGLAGLVALAMTLALLMLAPVSATAKHGKVATTIKIALAWHAYQANLVATATVTPAASGAGAPRGIVGFVVQGTSGTQALGLWQSPGHRLLHGVATAVIAVRDLGVTVSQITFHAKAIYSGSRRFAYSYANDSVTIKV